MKKVNVNYFLKKTSIVDVRLGSLKGVLQNRCYRKSFKKSLKDTCEDIYQFHFPCESKALC